MRGTGRETIDGTGTFHYRGTVTGDGLRALKGPTVEGAAEEHLVDLLDQLILLRVDERLTVDLWTDDEHRTRRLRLRAATGPLDLTITFLEVNRPVTVQPPPPADTTDLAGGRLQ